jgi:hypothetical protein
MQGRLRTRARTRGGAACTGVLATLLGLAACATDPRLAGPIPVRNHHPAQLTVQHLDPTDTRRLGAGGGRARLSVSQTSFFLGGSSPSGNTFVMDGELTRVTSDIEVGLGHGLRLRVQVPFGHASGGFLDDFVIDFHDAFGFNDQGRPEAPRNDFRVAATRAGDTVYRLEDDTVDLFDVPIELGYVVREAGVDGDFGFGVRAGVELPAGDGRAGFGNDEVDWALGLFGEWRPGYAQWLSVTGQAQHTFAGTPDRARDVGFRFRDVTSGGLSVEAAVHDRLALLAQLQFETSTLRDLGFSRVEDLQWLLWLGGRAHVGERTFVEVSIGEDIGPYVSPDFVAWIGVGTSWGAPGRVSSPR